MEPLWQSAVHEVRRLRYMGPAEVYEYLCEEAEPDKPTKGALAILHMCMTVHAWDGPHIQYIYIYTYICTCMHI